MSDLRERLTKQFEQRICKVCIHRKADGGCTLTEQHDCPVFRWADELTELIERVDSTRLADYIGEIQQVICPECMQDAHGHCEDREHLDCPLDLYTSLVVEILEEELQRTP